MLTTTYPQYLHSGMHRDAQLLEKFLGLADVARRVCGATAASGALRATTGRRLATLTALLFDNNCVSLRIWSTGTDLERNRLASVTGGAAARSVLGSAARLACLAESLFHDNGLGHRGAAATSLDLSVGTQLHDLYFTFRRNAPLL